MSAGFGDVLAAVKEYHSLLAELFHDQSLLFENRYPFWKNEQEPVLSYWLIPYEQNEATIPRKRDDQISQRGLLTVD
jgi:hypothetical protein